MQDHSVTKDLSLSEESILQKLKTSPDLDPDLEWFIQRHTRRLAAVLLPIYKQDSQWHVLLTRRSHKVSKHKGEIAFPGGRIDPEDPDALHAALRETHEEIGIPSDAIRQLGKLPDSISFTGYRIFPFVGVVPHPFPFQISEYEIDEIFSVPLRELYTSEVLRLSSYGHSEGKHFEVYEFLWKPGYRIWGATARILKAFLEICFGSIEAGRDETLELPTVEFSIPHQKS